MTTEAQERFRRLVQLTQTEISGFLRHGIRVVEKRVCDT
jgi:hypothetical protein